MTATLNVRIKKKKNELKTNAFVCNKWDKFIEKKCLASRGTQNVNKLNRNCTYIYIDRIFQLPLFMTFSTRALNEP